MLTPECCDPDAPGHLRKERPAQRSRAHSPRLPRVAAGAAQGDEEPAGDQVRHLPGLLAAEAHRTSDPNGSSRIGPSARSSTAAPADSRVAWAAQRSQMNTPGPAISLTHSSRERPQNELGPGQPLGAPTPPRSPRLGGLVDDLVDPLVAQTERLGDLPQRPAGRVQPADGVVIVGPRPLGGMLGLQQ
jgi:hypothetical protein